MAWVPVCRATELSEATPRRVIHDGRAICLALADGQPRAIDDQCPHRDIALSGGLLTNGIITCPGHFRRFDLRSGHWPAVGVGSQLRLRGGRRMGAH